MSTTPHTPVRRSTTTAAAAAAASPLTQRIRQQILKSDCVVGLVPTTPVPSSSKTSSLSMTTAKRRQRLERHQHRLGNRSSSPAVTATTTPLRRQLTTTPRSTTILRVSTATNNSPVPMKSSQASPKLPSIFTAENKAIATPSRQPAPGTPGSSKASSTNSTSKSQSRPASNQTLHLTPPPMVPAKSTKNTHSSSSNNNNNNNSMSRAATTPRTPLRAVPNSMVTPTSTSRSVIKDQSNKSLSLSSQKKSNKQQRHSPSTTSSKSTPKNRQGTHTAAPSSVSAGCTDTGTRMNLDKRSARLRYSNDFSNEIARLRQESSTSRSTTSTATPDDDKVLQDENNNKDDQGVLVFVRKRPIFRDELQRGDFDVVATTSSELDLTASSSTSGANSVVVYRTQMHADMKTKQVQPVVFGCTAAFDEKASSVHVYRTVAMPLVQQAVTGGVATLLMFGQTGSGKTFTMNAVEELSAADVFNFAPTNIKAASTSGKQITVQVRYLELSGKSCRDLLEDSRPEVRIMDNNNEDGSVCFVNATSVVVETAEELVKVMAEAKHRRATQATDKNDESSRSHAVCQMTIYARDAAEEKNHAARQRGVLTLVDCAGTERRNDSMYHSKSRQAESNEINASLYALKECIRARSSSASSQSQQGYVPYRSNNLTRVLRESLERQDASLAVIATVAPNATDTEHTIQTLKTVSTLSGLPSEEGRLQKVSNTSKLGEEHPIAPKRWDHKALVEWLSEKNLVEKAVPGHVDGKLAMRMSKILLRNTFYEDDGMDKAEVLFRCLRSETDRVDRMDWKRRIATSKTN